MNRHDAPLLSRSHFPVLALVAVASCGGGGDAAGVVVPAQAALLGGSWNLFQEGTDCAGAAFFALPLEIVDVASREYLVRIGDAAAPFEFVGQQVGDSVVVSGSSTVAGVTLATLPLISRLYTEIARRMTPAELLVEGRAPKIDVSLLAAAKAIEALMPWHTRPPTLLG